MLIPSPIAPPVDAAHPAFSPEFFELLQSADGPKLVRDAPGASSEFSFTQRSDGVTVAAGDGLDIVHGSLGNDHITAAGKYGLNTDHLLSPVQDLFGHMGDDVMRFVLDGAGRLYGGDGHDRLYAGDEAAYLYGEDGDDVLIGGAADDSLEGGNGHDRLYGGAGNDSLTSGDGNDRLRGQEGNDILLAGRGVDVLLGGTGDDAFYAHSNDRGYFWGEDGDDTFQMGVATRTLSGGAGEDTFQVYGAGAGAGYLKIKDFTSGEDTLIYHGWFSAADGYDDLRDFLNDRVKDTEYGCRIELREDAFIALMDVHLADLDLSDFSYW